MYEILKDNSTVKSYTSDYLEGQLSDKEFSIN